MSQPDNEMAAQAVYAFPPIHDNEATGDTARLGLCLPRLLDENAKRHSKKVALICADSSLTYEELSMLSNGLASCLVMQYDIGKGDMICVVMDRSIELVTILVAVMKAGAIYVPIDPTLPQERVNQMVNDACPRLVLTERSVMKSLRPCRSSCIYLDELIEKVGAHTEYCGPDVSINGDDLIYVMYTSGSTGRPKGVEISHGSVSNLLLSMQERLHCSHKDRLLATTTVSFDMAVPELFLPLLCGATTIIARTHEIRDAEALVGLMELHMVTMIQGTPAFWQMLLDSAWAQQLRDHSLKILCGGESLGRSLADRLLACSDDVWNLYGPTEATVYASLWKVKGEDDIIIGESITNGHLYVLDTKLSRVPFDYEGELYIGGAGVARGYRKNSELTKTSFLDNPFHAGQMYRTGDLARWIAPGKLKVLGRFDDQVKIRGHRVEIGDVEAAIMAHEGISETIVVYRDARLTAYIVPKTKTTDAEVKPKTLLTITLKPWLAERLPVYMLPAFYVEMDALPITSNGKIDRRVLPSPISSMQTRFEAGPKLDLDPLEGQIIAIWSEILGHSHLQADDNFFEVGGDSVRLVRVHAELEKLLGQPVVLAKLFEHYTVRTLASSLSHMSEATGIDVNPWEPKEGNDPTNNDIAIVSMACRLPGGVESPDDFWELLERGGDAIATVPINRWDAESLPDVTTETRRHCSYGGFVSSIDAYDTSFFGISPREACAMDPSHYLILETCWEGFERAGYTMADLDGSQTGVFIGTSSILAHQSLNPTAIQDVTEIDGHTVIGSAVGTMSGRISYHFGLQGPTLTVDTACSSSMVATHLACAALRQGECDLAISGAVSLMLNPGLHVEFSRLHGMSPDGRCRAFSADAQGTGWSEGSVAIVLKRLSDAQRDGDLVHAVIRGTAVNHGGRSASLTTPNGQAQKDLIRKALFAARLDPIDIDYVEAHGTATKLGDPIEATALAEVFGPSRRCNRPLMIGSVKSNIGHTQAAAGLVGLLKVVLAMKHATIPRTLHVVEPTSAVDWQRARMRLVQSPWAWQYREGRPRRAGISAFGIGGTNAHAIVEEAPSQDISSAFGDMSARQHPRMPILLSSDITDGLYEQAGKLSRWINRADVCHDLSDIAYSLAITRCHRRRRLVITASNKAELIESLDSISRSDCECSWAENNRRVPTLAMLFAGQGSQWPGMGKDLCEVYPMFSDTVHHIAAQFTELEMPLLDVMWAKPDSEAAKLLQRTDYAQPAIFALEVALWRLWQDWGVKPDYLLGHSLGELIAAFVAGVFDLADACRLVAARGRLMQALSSNGMMVSIAMSAAEVSAVIQQLGLNTKVEVSLYNAPMQTVISGDADAVGEVEQFFEQQEVRTKKLIIGQAFHSRHMNDMLGDLRTIAETIHFHPPKMRVISSMDGKLVGEGQLQHPEYWVEQVRQPVRFSDGLETLIRCNVAVFLELGPHETLSSIGQVSYGDDDSASFLAWLPSLSRRRNSVSVLQESLAWLHTRHVPLDWRAYFKPFVCQRVELPTYAFQRSSIKSVKLTQNVRKSSTTLDPSKDLDRLLFSIEWHPMEGKHAHVSGRWGLMCPVESVTWAGAVRDLLRQEGAEVVVVRDLIQAENMEGLFVLWDSSSSQDLTSTMYNVVRCALIQLQTAVRTIFSIPLIWVTHYAIGIDSDRKDEITGMETASLWGLMRTAKSEHPELQLRLVDLGQMTDRSIVAALLIHEEPECAVRGGQVLVPRLKRHHRARQGLALSRLHRSDGAVLMTGGLGSLGLHVVRWLVQNHGVCDLALTSRKGMKASGVLPLTDELSRLGVRVTVHVCDVSSHASVASLMKTFGTDRPLRGIFHLAGTVDSSVLLAMTPEQCLSTLAPKAFGAWWLHEQTRSIKLDFFVMFSSISGILGMPGLANYAAANAFLDTLAHFRRAQGLPATSVAYGTWAGTGMASRLSRQTQNQLLQYGLDPVLPQEGLVLLADAVTRILH